MDTKDKVFVSPISMSCAKKLICAFESQNNLWRLVIAGLAAAVVLKSDIDVGRFLPVVPIVGMLITAYWLGESLFVFRTGRWIAAMEAQINTLLGSDVLRYESTLWKHLNQLFGETSDSILRLHSLQRPYICFFF